MPCKLLIIVLHIGGLEVYVKLTKIAIKGFYQFLDTIGSFIEGGMRFYR